jgi:hypothetical protein
VTDGADHRFFAGWRSDPFFFDAQGALNNFQFTGQDLFADKDICTIVLEVPNTKLGTKKIGLWARTLAGAPGSWVQVDRGAQPQQSIFLPGPERNSYLVGEPAQDAPFVPAFAHSLEHTGGYTPEEARRVAARLLPDIMLYEPGHRASFPTNGRTLTDDAVDHFFTILTNGKLTSDGVGPHSDLLDEFPYLGPPHRVTSDSSELAGAGATHVGAG